MIMSCGKLVEYMDCGALPGVTVLSPMCNTIAAYDARTMHAVKVLVLSSAVPQEVPTAMLFVQPLTERPVGPRALLTSSLTAWRALPRPSV